MKPSLLILVLGFFLLSCASTPPPRVERNTAELERLAQDVNDEVVVGRQMAAKLLGFFGPYAENSEAEAYVNLVGATLVRRIGRPELKFHFGILKSTDINAFAAPGGYIFITSGLLQAVNNESELAAVLAHEIAHVNERHMADEILPRRDPTAGSVVVSLLSRGRSTIGVSLSSIVNRGMELLLEKGLGETREVEADAAAVAYTAACGYNPSALLNFLTRARGGKFGKVSKPSVGRLTRLAANVSTEGVPNRALGDEKIMQSRFTASLASAFK